MAAERLEAMAAWYAAAAISADDRDVLTGCSADVAWDRMAEVTLAVVAEAMDDTDWATPWMLAIVEA
jgi:hypothetical protein